MDYLKIKDEKVKSATGKTWSQWFSILDKWHARQNGHYQTAKYIGSQYDLNGWWSQVVTIRYEKERDTGNQVTTNSKNKLLIFIQSSLQATLMSGLNLVIL